MIFTICNCTRMLGARILYAECPANYVLLIAIACNSDRELGSKAKCPSGCLEKFHIFSSGKKKCFGAVTVDRSPHLVLDR